MYFLALLVIVLEGTIAGVPNLHRRQEDARHRYEVEEINSDDFLANFLENFPEISDETRRKPISTIITDPVKVPQENHNYHATIKSLNPTEENVRFQDVPDDTIRNFASTTVTDSIPLTQETASKLEARSDIVTGFGAMAAVISSAVAQIMSFFARKKLLVVAIIAGVLGTIGISEVFTDDLLAFAENITGQRLQREGDNIEEPTEVSQESLLTPQFPGGDDDDITESALNDKMVEKPVMGNIQSQNVASHSPNMSDSDVRTPVIINASGINEAKETESIENPENIDPISDLDMEGSSEEDMLTDPGEKIGEVSEPNESNSSDSTEDKEESSSDTENDDYEEVAKYKIASLTRDFDPSTFPFLTRPRPSSPSLTTEPSLDPVDIEPINESENELFKVSDEVNKDVDTEILNANERKQEVDKEVEEVDKDVDQENVVLGSEGTNVEVTEILNANERKQEVEKEVEGVRAGTGKVGPDFSTVGSKQGENLDLGTSDIQNNLVNVSHEQVVVMVNESEALTSNIIPVPSNDVGNHAEDSRILDSNFKVSDDTEMKSNTIKALDGKILNQEEREETEEQIEIKTEEYKDIFETIELELELLPSIISPELKEIKPTVFVNEEVADDGI